MSSKMWKSTFREIKQSFGRFMAIFAITALGVSLFSGLKVIQPAMVKTTNAYFQEKEFYDYRVLSNLGFEREDLEYLKEQEDVRTAEGIVTFDMLCSIGDENANVIKIYNLPERINDIELLYGRMPEAADECIVDSSMYRKESLGEKINLSTDNDEDDLENFAIKEFTIVGIAQASNYIQFERGNTSIGNGKIAGFMYLPMEAFDVDYYTEILVKFDEDFKIYSDEYETYIDEKEPVWEKMAEQASENRHNRIVTEATEELEDAKREFEEEKADAETELEDARIELADAYEELTDAQKEIADARKELADGRAALEENRKTLDDAGYEIGYNRVKLEKAQEEIEENRKLLASASAELSEGQQKIDEGRAQIPLSRAEIDNMNAGIDGLKTALESYDPAVDLNGDILLGLNMQAAAVLGPLQGFINPTPGEGSNPGNGNTGQTPTLQTTEQLLRQIALIQPVIDELDKGLAQLEIGQAEIDAGREQISDAKRQLEEAEEEIADGFRQIEEGIEQWEDGMRQLSEGEAELLKGESELADAEKELADGWVEYYDGLEEYEEGYQEFVVEIADAEAEIADAEQEIADIEEPESFLLGRETNVGYVCMENDSAIVNGIANVFPVFFYAVAALVCVTTMNRMIEEQTQIVC